MTSFYNYYKKVFDRFGWPAIIFLLKSKLVADKLNRSVRGIAHPVSLSNFDNDVMTLFQVFYGKEYQLPFQFKPEVIVDCGANIGLSAVWFANAYPDAKIIAVEPDPVNYSYLRKNTSAYPNVVCLNNAVWTKKTMLQMVDPGPGNWSLQTKEASDQQGMVESVTLPEIMERFSLNQIDLLKIDIEGAEKELLLSASEEWLSRTKVLAIELHDNLDPEIPSIFRNAIARFQPTVYQNGENAICDLRSNSDK